MTSANCGAAFRHKQGRPGFTRLAGSKVKRPVWKPTSTPLRARRGLVGYYGIHYNTWCDTLFRGRRN